jgi:hypothetical protein
MRQGDRGFERVADRVGQQTAAAEPSSSADQKRARKTLF